MLRQPKELPRAAVTKTSLSQAPKSKEFGANQFFGRVGGLANSPELIAAPWRRGSDRWKNWNVDTYRLVCIL